MDYLEKLFLFTLALSFLTMAFMFGLYFDLGDMITGKVSGGTAFRAAMAESAVALLEYGARIASDGGGESARAVFVDNNEDYGMPATMGGFVEGHGKPVERRVVVDLKRAELKRLGFTHKGFIEMEALNKNRKPYIKTMADVDHYLSAQQYELAIEAIRNTIDSTAKGNLYVLRDLWARLINIYYRAKQFDEARTASYNYVDFEERILRNREGASIPVHQSEWKRLQELRASIEPYYQKLKAGGGPPTIPSGQAKQGMSRAEMAEARQNLLDSYKRGEITRDEFEKLKADYGF